MMHCLVADIQTVTDAAQPVHQRLPLRKVALVGIEHAHGLRRVVVHPLDGRAERNLGFVAHMRLPDCSLQCS